ncbi:hypothetical protein, partial [Sphingobium chungbukense]
NRGKVLIGAECTAERDAFLTLIEHALPSCATPLAQAIRTIRTLAIRALPGERAEAQRIIASSLSELDGVLETLVHASLPGEPLERLLALIDSFRYSRDIGEDSLSATAHSPCWAINLVATAQAPLFHLGEIPLPFPGVVQRRLFRADRGPAVRREDAKAGLLDALHNTLCDIALMPRASALFAKEFPDQRSNSRLYPSWMMLYALGSLTPAQLARALPATKAGAAKLLRQLVTRRLANNGGSFEPFFCATRLTVSFPDAPHKSPDETSSDREHGLFTL